MEKKVCCPYESSHVMQESRLSAHISNPCQAQIRFGHLYGNCPYNTLHIYRKEYLEKHINQCPERDKKQKKREEIDLEDEMAMAAIAMSFKQKPKPTPEETYNKNKTIAGYDLPPPPPPKKSQKKPKKISKRQLENEAKENEFLSNWQKESYGANSKALDKKVNIIYDLDWRKVWEEEEEERKRM